MDRIHRRYMGQDKWNVNFSTRKTFGLGTLDFRL
jgi:hypothetical protein